MTTRRGVDLATVGLTLSALLAFASNSLLTRLALGSGEIDAATFTGIRLVSGAAMLAVLVLAQARSWKPLHWRGPTGPLALFAYAAPFSFAYLRIGAAVGALVLFGVVQLTMIGYGIARGERPVALAWLGLVLAAGGLAMLAVPSVGRPDPLSILLTTVAGVAWAIYTIAGRSAPDALGANARSFLWCSPAALLLAFLAPPAVPPSARGVLLALVSGAVTSGAGYAVWYRALPRLSVTQAAVAQLSVPVIAAVGAALLLGEPLTPRLVAAGAAVLSGVGLVLAARTRLRVARAAATSRS